MKKTPYTIYPVDCAIKAYFLGFIACDASLYEPSNKMQLEITDESVIKLFSEIMDSKYVEYDKYDKRTNKTYHGYRIYKCINDIINIYKGRIKTDRHLPYQYIPIEYLPFLIQGVFDADGTMRGTIYSEKRIDVDIQISSSKNIIHDTFNILKLYAGIEGKIHNEGSYYGYYIYNKYDFVRFFQWIYSKPWFIPMPRKYIKAVNIVQTMLNMNKSHLLPNINNTFMGNITSPFMYKPFTRIQ